jgi:hypothetical protein
MIIGLVGFIGAGKGTVGDLLRLQGYKQASFAGALKDTASQMFGWDRDLLEGDTNESREFREQRDDFWSNRFGYDFSPRLALQLLGTEAGRNVFHKDIWIYALENRIRNHKNVVVTDTRFPNEIDFIRSKGGVIIEVRRGDRPEWYETAFMENNDPDNHNGDMNDNWPQIHVSEWAWIGQHVDYTINNSGTIDDLRNRVKEILTELEVRDTINILHNEEGVLNEVI